MNKLYRSSKLIVIVFLLCMFNMRGEGQSDPLFSLEITEFKQTNLLEWKINVDYEWFEIHHSLNDSIYNTVTAGKPGKKCTVEHIPGLGANFYRLKIELTNGHIYSDAYYNWSTIDFLATIEEYDNIQLFHTNGNRATTLDSGNYLMHYKGVFYNINNTDIK